MDYMYKRLPLICMYHMHAQTQVTSTHMYVSYTCTNTTGLHLFKSKTFGSRWQDQAHMLICLQMDYRHACTPEVRATNAH